MSETSTSVFTPNRAALLFWMALSWGLPSYLLCELITNPTLRRLSASDFRIAIGFILLFFAFATFALISSTGEAHISEAGIVRRSPFSKKIVLFANVKYAQFSYSRGGLSLAIGDGKSRLVFSEVVFSAQDLTEIRQRVMERCAALSVQVQTENPPLAPQTMTKVAIGYLFLICAAFGSLIFFSLKHRGH